MLSAPQGEPGSDGVAGKEVQLRCFLFPLGTFPLGPHLVLSLIQ